MSYIGICEYVIGIIHDRDTWFYSGEESNNSQIDGRFSSSLFDAKRYDDMDVLRMELEELPKTLAYKIIEVQRCPKCKKDFVGYPAISREDNETEICPKCGVREAIEAFQKAARE